MTTKATAKTITIAAPGAITVNKDGSITLPLENATELSRAVLAARKAAYAVRRTDRKVNDAQKIKERKEKLEKQLAALSAAA